MNTDIHTLAGAYVLDAVDDVERAAFARHLADCDSCAAEVDELRETVARLADGTWSVPPPRLRAEVLGQVGRTRQAPPGTRPGHDDTATPSRWRRITATAAAAVVLAAGTATATYVVQEQRVRDERAAAAAARREAAQIQAVLSAPDVKVRTGTVAGGGRVTVVVSAARDAGVVVMADAPVPPAGRAYQLWLLSGTTPTSAAVLEPGRSGATRLVEGVRGKDAFGVTVEPAGGSRTPTLPTVAAIPLT
jgi:anti-sigma-K factor RskA